MYIFSHVTISLILQTRIEVCDVGIRDDRFKSIEWFLFGSNFTKSAWSSLCSSTMCASFKTSLRWLFSFLGWSSAGSEPVAITSPCRWPSYAIFSTPTVRHRKTRRRTRAAEDCVPCSVCRATSFVTSTSCCCVVHCLVQQASSGQDLTNFISSLKLWWTCAS